MGPHKSEYFPHCEMSPIFLIAKILIAKNFNGYKKLMEISSRIQLEDNGIEFNDNNLLSFDFNIGPNLFLNKKDLDVFKTFYLMGARKSYNNKRIVLSKEVCE